MLCGLAKYIYSESSDPHLSKTSTRSKIPSLHFENGRLEIFLNFFFQNRKFSKSKKSRKSLKSLRKIENFRFLDFLIFRFFQCFWRDFWSRADILCLKLVNTTIWRVLSRSEPKTSPKTLKKTKNQKIPFFDHNKIVLLVVNKI